MPTNVLESIYKNKVKQGMDFPLVNIKPNLLIIGDSYSAGNGGYVYLKDLLCSLCGVTSQNNRASGGTRSDYAYTTSSVQTQLLNSSTTYGDTNSCFYYYGFNDVGQGTSPIDVSPNLTSNSINESIYGDSTTSILHNCCCNMTPNYIALANNTTKCFTSGTWSNYTTNNTWSRSANVQGSSIETSNQAFPQPFRYASFHITQTGTALDLNFYVNNVKISNIKRPSNILPTVQLGITVIIDLEIASNYVLKVELNSSNQHVISHFCVWNDTDDGFRQTIAIEKNKDTYNYDSRYATMTIPTYWSRQELYKRTMIDSCRMLRSFNLPISFFEMPYIATTYNETDSSSMWHPTEYEVDWRIPSLNGTTNLNS